MAEREPVSLDALNGLLKERQRYEEWLAALEDKRATTPESVYQRVQGDYQTRLREVSSKLAERAGELRENIDALTIKLEDINEGFALMKRGEESVVDRMRAESAQFSQQLKSAELREAIQAFREKRAPNFDKAA